MLQQHREHLRRHQDHVLAALVGVAVVGVLAFFLIRRPRLRWLVLLALLAIAVALFLESLRTY